MYLILTNFARVVIGTHHHATASVTVHWSSRTTHHVREWLAFVHCLHCKDSHLVRHVFEVINIVDSFFGHHLYLCSSAASQ